MPRSTISSLLPAHIERAAFADPAHTGCARAMPPTRPTPASITAPTASARSRPARMSCSNRTRIGRVRRPHFRRITVRAIENTAALEANLLSGTIDMVAGELGLSLDEALAFEKRQRRRASRSSTSRAWSSSMSTSTSTGPLWPIAGSARRCSSGSTARRSASSLFAGRQPVADSFVNPLDAGYSADIAALPLRPDARRGAAR